MGDPYADRIAAAKRRLKVTEETGAETEDAQDANAERLADLDATVEAAASRLGADLDQIDDAFVPLESDQPEQAAPGGQGTDPVEAYLQVSEEFATGLRKDRAYLIAEGVESVSWDELLPADAIAEIEARLDRPVKAEPMDRADLITVGVCAGLGVLAVLLDDKIDGFVKDRLMDLHKPSTTLGQSKLGKKIRSADKAGERLAIDYGGKGIGQPDGGHRFRSSGHDLLRVFDALEQIRTGRFQGHRWEDGVKLAVSADRPAPGRAAYRQVQGNEAIMVWLKHLASDFTTDKSLPLPGATYIHELPNHELRSIGNQAYMGGLNLRRVMISGMLPVATVEAGVRLSVHVRTWRETESVRLSPERKAKLHQMLLLTHGIVAAASAGKVAVRWSAGEGPAALRHLNLAVILAVAGYSVPVMTRYLKRNDAGRKYERNEDELAGGWDKLLAGHDFMGTVGAFEEKPRFPVAL